MAKIHAALISLFCLIAVSAAFVSEAQELIAVPTETVKEEESDHRSTVEPLTATLLPVKEEPDSKPANRKPTFRPVNRRFSPRNPWSQSFPDMRDVEIPFVNDMLIASGENSDFAEAIPRSNMHHRHHLRHRLHHHHPRGGQDCDSDDEGTKKVVLRVRQDGHHFSGKKRPETLEKMKKHFRDHKEEKQRNTSGGFFETVRKFLDNYW